jgi:hypothetical protein
MADQWPGKLFRAAGNRHILTPTLDQLARLGSSPGGPTTVQTPVRNAGGFFIALNCLITSDQAHEYQRRLQPKGRD